MPNAMPVTGIQICLGTASSAALRASVASCLFEIEQSEEVCCVCISGVSPKFEKLSRATLVTVLIPEDSQFTRHSGFPRNEGHVEPVDRLSTSINRIVIEGSQPEYLRCATVAALSSRLEPLLGGTYLTNILED